MCGDIFVIGGLDGLVWIWLLEGKCVIYRFVVYDNSVMSFQFDEIRVVSGGSDGCVKIWDLKIG